MKPTIGRIVHYKKDGDGGVVPAIITSVDQEDEIITLTLFNAMSPVSATEAEIVPAAGPGDATDGQWWWPERL